MIRRSAALVCALLGLGLVAAPVALAQSETAITAEANVQFSGVVDSSPSCNDKQASPHATIDWGDGSADTDGTINLNTGAVSGTHMYTAVGDYDGTVTLTNDDSCGSGTVDYFTAHVEGGPAQFTQCPPVDFDSGCQFLIVVSKNGTTIENDPNQPAYENADDSLIGVVNNGSGPISSIPLSSPNSDLFGFDGDGICNPGEAPLPPGCQPQPGSPAGTTCGAQDNSCSFPAPSGQPAGDVEPGAPSGFTQNGYEGPTSWFSNVSADTSSGVVNFSPPLQPGQSTYFSLEEPPTTNALNAGSTPNGISSSPPTVSATGANFTGVVNPNGSPTTVSFQYGLDGNYGIAKAPFSQSTSPQNIGGDFSNHVVNGSAFGLDPNATYAVRLVATNKNGTTYGPTLIFTTKKAPAPSNPTLGKTFNVSTVSGLVLIKVNGKFVPLTEVHQIPANTVIDALGGTIKLISSSGGVAPASDARAKKSKKSKAPKTFIGTFTGGVFKVTQALRGANKALTTLTLQDSTPAFKGAASYATTCKAAAAGDSSPVGHAAYIRRVYSTSGRASGRYSTRGRYGAGTVRGTKWTVTDRCDGTLIAVQLHSVLVTDFVKHITKVITAGHHYLAKAPTKKHK